MQHPQHFTWRSLLLLSIPFWIYFLILLGEQFASSLPWYRSWQPVVLVMGGVLVANMVGKRRRLKKTGFASSRPGFSGEVDVLAKKLQDRLQEMERALRFQRAIDPMPREFGEFAFEVIQTALVIDKKEILTRWKALQHEDETIRFQLQLQTEHHQLDPDFQQQFDGYTLAMRNAIEELHLYSHGVKQKGGLYKISRKEIIVASVLIVVFSIGGAFLMWKHWLQWNWLFWTGVAGVAVSGILLALLISVLKDQESSNPASLS
jgi:hypothetical protein